MIRKEEQKDRAVVLQLTRDSFGQWDESDLVKQLYLDDDVIFGLVYEQDKQILGHILFSKMQITSRDMIIQAACLAPVSVHPDHQRRGIGSELIHAGIQLCRDIEELSGIIVLGDPNYYPRFGFSSSVTQKLKAPFEGDTFMGLEFRKGIIPEGGNVSYAKAFGL